MRFRSPRQSDLQQIVGILKNSNLPYEDCGEHLDHFLVVEVSEKIIGIGGLELYGEFALLRSIAVLQECRGQDVGNAIYGEIKDKALSLGVKELYLLTETAEEYFGARGFSVLDRELVPKEIRQTRQFSSLCPSSAVVMKYVFL